MHVRFVASVLFGLMLAAVPALAQTHPLRGPDPSGGVAEPDQPVRPEIPTLVPRAPQQPAAQPPGPPPPPFMLTPQEEAQVDGVLKQWEQRNRGVKTFDCKFKRWTYDKVFGARDKAKFIDVGVIKYKAPDLGLFRVETTEKNGKDVRIEDARADYWMSDGKSIFIFAATKRQLIEQKLPPELQGQAIADGPLPFVFGAEAKKLEQRYWIRLVTPPDVKDQLWLEAWPRYQQDAANFHRAQFIITTPDMSPFALKLVQPGQNENMVYQFYDIVVNDPLRLFKGDPFRPFTPLGWQKIVEEPLPAAQARRGPNNGQR